MTRNGSVAAMLFAASLGISAVALAERPPAALARAGVARSGMSNMGKRGRGGGGPHACPWWG
jgi:hypothetical protein